MPRNLDTHLLRAFVAVADTRDSAPWALGIPRLKLLPEAPSRSALKLDEALLTLMTPEERQLIGQWIAQGAHTE